MNLSDVLENELDRLLQWVRAAESRLALVLPLSMAMIGALAISVPGGREWSKMSVIASIVAVSFLVLSVVFSALAFFPRTTGPKGSLIYFGEIGSMSREDYVRSVKKMTEETYIEDLASQCHRNAEIASKKYAWIQRSMICLFLSSAPWAAALLTIYA